GDRRERLQGAGAVLEGANGTGQGGDGGEGAEAVRGMRSMKRTYSNDTANGCGCLLLIAAIICFAVTWSHIGPWTFLVLFLIVAAFVVVVLLLPDTEQNKQQVVRTNYGIHYPSHEDPDDYRQREYETYEHYRSGADALHDKPESISELSRL